MNSGFKSHQEQGHTETRPWFKVSSERPEKPGSILLSLDWWSSVLSTTVPPLRFVKSYSTHKISCSNISIHLLHYPYIYYFFIAEDLKGTFALQKFLTLFTRQKMVLFLREIRSKF